MISPVQVALHAGACSWTTTYLLMAACADQRQVDRCPGCSCRLQGLCGLQTYIVVTYIVVARKRLECFSWQLSPGKIAASAAHTSAFALPHFALLHHRCFACFCPVLMQSLLGRCCPASIRRLAVQLQARRAFSKCPAAISAHLSQPLRPALARSPCRVTVTRRNFHMASAVAAPAQTAVATNPLLAVGGAPCGADCVRRRAMTLLS